MYFREYLHQSNFSYIKVLCLEFTLLFSFPALNKICSWWTEVVCETFSTQAELVKGEQNRVWGDKRGFVTHN